tara:strand:- start:1063 stop:1233 length:171 start_codon:yes stop_codon:yes gene_type:complete
MVFSEPNCTIPAFLRVRAKLHPKLIPLGLSFIVTAAMRVWQMVAERNDIEVHEVDP